MQSDPLILVEEALARICDNLPVQSVEPLGIDRCHGRVLAEDVMSELTHPAADISAMDGFAIGASLGLSSGLSFTVIGEAAAGSPFTGLVGPGEAVRIFTGGYLAAGTDTIVVQEEVEKLSDGRILLTETAETGQFVRPQGLDFSAGDLLLPRGKRLSARDIALAALSGAGTLRVRTPPRVGILSSGDELVRPGEHPRVGQLVNSNSLFLQQLVKITGGDPVDLGIIRDIPGALTQVVAEAGPFDLLITTGGASVGDHDHIVSDITTSQNGSINFWKIAMRPGKPLIFGSIGETPILGLPGNPVSAGVCGLIFVKPALHALLGSSDQSVLMSAPLATSLPKNGRRQDYMRGYWVQLDDGSRAVMPASRQDSSMLGIFTHSEVLIIRPPHSPAVAEGSLIDIMPIPNGI
tara:strand:+ start:2410 stop:3633 length:1224 start_codon:yes stop_codon:yes gene_type:complete